MAEAAGVVQRLPETVHGLLDELEPSKTGALYYSSQSLEAPDAGFGDTEC
jgi:hypothetical protein